MPPPDPRVVAAEMIAQADMQERGKRLSAFRAKTEGKVWRHITRTGEWLLETVVDGTASQT